MPVQTNPYSPDNCPSCGALPSTGVVGGSLCPRCLLVAGLAQRGATATDPGQLLSGSQHRWEPPTPAELADQFPELEIIELAGRGGMGAVYKVRQKDLNRTVALKILPPEVAENPAFAVRFERESQALAKLNHANIVQVYHSGKTDRYYYFLMEFVDGVNLRQAIQEGNLQPGEALAIVPQICEALQYAHNEGVVHRDIKPENILLDKDGRVKVTDFGLAKMIDWAHDASLTGTQQVMGTVHYMAPEQVQETRNVDHRADIYSLGVVFYEMLTGQLPLGRFAPPSESTSVDPRLDRVVMRTLENEPNRRYQAAIEVKTDIDSIGQPGSKLQQPAQTSFVPAPPVKKTIELATRKVRMPALCLQTIGYLSVAISVMLVFLILLSVGLRISQTEGPSNSIPIACLTGGAGMASMNSLSACTLLQNESLGANYGNNTPLIGQESITAIPAARATFAVIAILGLGLLHFPISIMMIIAGRKMIRLESYGFAVVTCILAMIPLNPLFFLFSFAIAVWTLIVLSDASVKLAFEERERAA